ncbi:oxygen-insensitive NADPH nitroreductase [Psychrobacter sp.]|uniref:oxygen-insensitive NADPH nitroreductase n=1 Tax=Psychrobacter sp. TaxID=56811 RepID=UPI0025F06E13|nr:oxygen-insensitive NADPH nitroreductase [Psychrobacter sp.]
MTDVSENIKRMNSTLEAMLSHRSVRSFTEEPISPEMLEAVLEAGRAASTSNYMQSVSIIRITDPQQRIKFHQISNGMSEEEYNKAKSEGKKLAHQYILECPEYLVFCMDNYRHQLVEPEAQLDWMEVVLISAVDAGLYAQNVLAAAESLGLGGVYIGSMRNDIERAGEVIKAPKHVVPLFGMCLGHPSDSPVNATQKPRFPLSMLVSENEYKPATQQQIDAFNETVKSYYEQRGSDNHQAWEAQVTKTFATAVRPQVMPYLNKQGYAKR